jgi:hypothetical protein
MLPKRRFDLAELHAEAPHLHLGVGPTRELDDPSGR